VNLSVAVQHHPARAGLLPLLTQLGDHEVVADDPALPMSPFRCYLECLRRTPKGATHRLVVQDDAIPCVGFREFAEQAVRERPDDLIAFFVPGRTLLRRDMLAHHRRGERWYTLPNLNWTPTVALCWPAGMARAFVPFGEDVIATRALRGLTTQGDDPYVGAWRKKHDVPVVATVPSLVQHPDTVTSLFRPHRKPQAGRNRARVAALFVDDLPTLRVA